MEGGDGMDAVTWHDLIYLLMEIATLIIVVLSYLNRKKDNRPATKLAVIF